MKEIQLLTIILVMGFFVISSSVVKGNESVPEEVLSEISVVVIDSSESQEVSELVPVTVKHRASPNVSKHGMTRGEIKSLPILERPSRVGHFYGNTVRRRAGVNN